MKKFNKLQALALSAIMIVNVTGTAFANQAAGPGFGPGSGISVQKGDIVVLYTNDVHTHVDNGGLRYSNVAALKNELESAGAEVLLVDAGDHIQGTAFGSMDKGETIVKLMNAAEYDLATFGNHEFDYGMEGAMNVLEWADFPYVSANFYHEVNGVKTGQVLDSYKVFDFGDTEIAFVGITTPDTFTKSTPAYFQDGNGNYIYGIASGEDGSELYEAVQTAIDAASKEADLVIGLGHLGVDLSSCPWTSEEVIANTTGFDAFIDGHSHTTIEGKAVKDKAGNDVWLTQTGEYLNAVGKMTIKADGSIATELIKEYKNTDDRVRVIEENWINEINTELGQVIGSTSDTLDNYDANGKRLVRSQETNTGNFAADALYYLFDNMGLDVDVAVMNGGGIRNKAVTGNISYLTCKEIHTFGNVACLQTVTGQQILDALEWGAKDVGVAENGGFLHVSGLKYTIDPSIPSTVQADDKEVWIGGPTGAYRVGNVQILNKQTGEYEALDLNAKYNLAGYNYTLRDLGDGFAMFDGAVNVL
ncbi:MAG: bifunctional metallophosphatase/5'-nucleotidase, partial [Lachnospiraceae bacterium]|nr:bifunctional metallophosphatase/5'-nucleotidase [Lachnospiraceae bacterium]MBQ5699608.1 bifunctional metallophosphatase/5'-nucleotidase [Lachnospiraceae bacterium]